MMLNRLSDMFNSKSRVGNQRADPLFFFILELFEKLLLLKGCEKESRI